MKWLKCILLALAAFLIIAQFIRPARTNPAEDPAKVLHAPAPVMSIVQRSCFDCHSYRTTWPWYAQVAPASWLLARDVKGGRRNLNLSDWSDYTPRRAARKLQQICEQVEGNEMPLWFYVPLHPRAKLSNADRQTLCTWAKAERAQIIAAHPQAAQPGRR